MQPTALIAEDEPLLAQALRAELARAWPGLKVVAVAADGATALQQALALQPTVCFLDIRMPALSGLEVAQALAEDWPAVSSDAPGDAPFPLLVFITAYDQYAVQAFDAQAVDYLLKPVEPARLGACCERLRQRLAQRAAPELQRAVEQLRALLGPPGSATTIGAGPTSSPDRGPALPPSHEPAASPIAPRLQVIQAGVGATVHLVPVDEVIYFEAADKYLRVITAEREHLIRLSLRELLPQLDAQRFWQVHRGLVVQAKLITSATRDESGKVQLSLRGRSEKLMASRLYAHLFKAM
jgi:DNA-binding LytR/AlgR family response regulator